MKHIWIKQRLKHEGKKAKDLAEALNLPPSRISEMVAGTREIAANEIPVIARFFGMRQAEVLAYATGTSIYSNEPVDQDDDEFLAPPSAVGKRDLKVRGAAVAGGDGDGDFSFNGEIADYVPRPPGLIGVNDAFALYVQGDSMSPRYEPGNLIYIHPGRPPAPGNDVVVECLPREGETNGPCYLKRLVRRHAAKVELRQFNPSSGQDQKIEIDQKKIKNIWRIMTLEELMGVG